MRVQLWGHFERHCMATPKDALPGQPQTTAAPGSQDPSAAVLERGHSSAGRLQARPAQASCTGSLQGFSLRTFFQLLHFQLLEGCTPRPSEGQPRLCTEKLSVQRPERHSVLPAAKAVLTLPRQLILTGI